MLQAFLLITSIAVVLVLCIFLNSSKKSNGPGKAPPQYGPLSLLMEKYPQARVLSVPPRDLSSGLNYFLSLLRAADIPFGEGNDGLPDGTRRIHFKFPLILQIKSLDRLIEGIEESYHEDLLGKEILQAKPTDYAIITHISFDNRHSEDWVNVEYDADFESRIFLSRSDLIF